MKRNGIGCVRRVWASRQKVNHLFGVTVIRRDDRRSSSLPYPFGYPSQVSTYWQASMVLSFPCDLPYRIRKVDHKYGGFTFVYRAQHFVSNLECRHRRLQIISRDLW